MTRLQVLSPGPLTTVQDRGRTGWRHLGVAHCGALDATAATLANRLVGNDADEAVLELTLQGPTLQFDRPLRLAICGAGVQARFESATGERCVIESGRPATLPAGVLRVGTLRNGARAWLAFAGGLDVPPVLGSRSTDLRGGFGGHEGRALRSGDALSLRTPRTLACTQAHSPRWWIDPDFDERGLPIRYVPSPQAGGALLDGRQWRAGNRSNRQGLRLEGATLANERPEEISAPVAPGTVQLPPDGQPIVLLADAQTVGGYPRLGHVVAADLPRLAQLRPGDSLRFQACDLQTATHLACAARARIARISLMIERKLIDQKLND
ncbi:5-oxoprolinase subunit C family protein [Lysobacter solisilvae (ex Woo and Kim 2020)]|uniref:Biotin-dependent carboxyltransferase family protein n=1 Tax=Agrilutibacter terrestris TaxID=2865112 RepID=A0A7H0FWE5_9GAMM|nr:biotin-dependent carboxyltransferase family protein [Lysobacter terrestris]QNP40361.1 biotin-dependent carboxyltransferase family protein [Lysobacter terrestris]